MPMIDAHIPEGALAPAAEATLLRELTDILIRWEGFDPANERARAATWTFLHRPTVYVAGEAPAAPRYRFIVSVPEGQYDDERRAGVVREMTEAVARAEGADVAVLAPRVWVFPLEVNDGRWGGRGAVRRLPDILAALEGEHARQEGAARMRERRRRDALAILRAAVEG